MFNSRAGAKQTTMADKIYLHDNKKYKLITKGISHGTFREVLADGTLGDKFVSEKILKDGQQIKETNNQKGLF